MTPPDTGSSPQSNSLGAPDHDRSGPTIDESVEKAEAGSQVEGKHIPSGQAPSGESRLEQMPDVAGVGEGRVDGNPDEKGTPPEAGPSPGDIGSGGAQRIAGARISDRVAGGEPVPDGPPFDTDSQRNEQDPSGAGA